MDFLASLAADERWLYPAFLAMYAAIYCVDHLVFRRWELRQRLDGANCLISPSCPGTLFVFITCRYLVLLVLTEVTSLLQNTRSNSEPDDGGLLTWTGSIANGEEERNGGEEMRSAWRPKAGRRRAPYT